jgi:chromosome segregation ATPase
MARRRASKAGSKTAPAVARPHQGREPAKTARGGSLPGNGALRERLAAVERECDALRAELERFKAQQRQLEETHAQVRDRLTWALDSLHSILASKG